MANKLDQIFREGLDQLEVRPTPDAWSEVQARLSGNKKPSKAIPLSIAATVAVVIISSVIMMSNWSKDQGTPTLTDVDHPQQLNGHRWKFPPLVIDYVASNEEAETVAQKTASNTAQAPDDVKREITIQTIQVDAINRVEVMAQMPSGRRTLVGVDPSEKVENEPFIKITYIAGDNTKGEDDGKRNKVFSAAREVSPMNLLSDIRNAKDNLFRKNN